MSGVTGASAKLGRTIYPYASRTRIDRNSLCHKSVDELKIRILPHLDVSFAQLEILINGQALLELVGGAEEPLVQAEYDAEVAGGNIDAKRIESGQYMHPTIGTLNQWNALSFGTPQFYFDLGSDDDDYDSTVLLACNCGNPGCWMLLVDTFRTDESLTWRNFRQFHRPDWVYRLGPFTFNANTYESQIADIMTQASILRADVSVDPTPTTHVARFHLFQPIDRVTEILFANSQDGILHFSHTARSFSPHKHDTLETGVRFRDCVLERYVDYHLALESRVDTCILAVATYDGNNPESICAAISSYLRHANVEFEVTRAEA